MNLRLPTMACSIALALTMVGCRSNAKQTPEDASVDGAIDQTPDLHAPDVGDDVVGDGAVDQGPALDAPGFAPPAGDLCTTSGWCWVSPTPQGGDLAAVWSNGLSDVWAFGKSILHWNGTAWSLSPLDLRVDLQGAWGSGPDDVWAVGRSGTIVHWDGTTWSGVKSGTTDDLHGLWGSGPNDVWAV